LNTESLAFLARSATCFLLGWYVALGGVADYQFIRLVNWAALDYIAPIPKMVVCWYAGKTVGLIVVGKVRG
jgi:hypothetical protein